LIHVIALLRRHDPDLLLTGWGDSWLLSYLLQLAGDRDIPLPLNREARWDVIRRPQRSYFSYGQVIYRGPQVRLFGRWHIDACNAVMFRDYGLEGVLEMSRVTGLSVQRAARVSPGTGISAMQITTALRQEILIPWHKQQAERQKSARQLLHADKGGLVFQPLTGLHQNVAEIDFVSMYPSIMAHFNISPETVGKHCPNARWIPELELPITRKRRGLVPQTLKPLLEKRIQLKSRLSDLHPRNVLYKRYQSQASAHKWLLVTCFGYLGYKNARFGRIEAHEAVTAYGREALLRAKEAAEDLGYSVLHMYVDGLWVQKEACSAAADFEHLLNEIIRRTRLPVSLEGIYQWIAFLPSRIDARVPVANRYFGAFQNGDLKLRGIEVRRKDTPPFIARAQMDVLHIMARTPSAVQLLERLPELISLFQERLTDLRAGRIPLPQLLVSQKLSRTLEEYRVPSPVARAVAQLQQKGKSASPGQRVRFIYTRGEPGVHAWDLPDSPHPDRVDTLRYAQLLLKAASTVLQPLGVRESTLRDWLFSDAGYCNPPGVLSSDLRQAVPLFSSAP
jgi:DNA polymerase-2